MLSVKEAEKIILNLSSPLNNQQDIETVDLSLAPGRILAAPVISKLDFPHWDNSAMDGYAVLYKDVQKSHPENPAVLDIVEEIPAGYQPQIIIKSGEAARIFTGALMPTGADTVVMQEHTTRHGDRIIILKAPKYQEFVRHQGSYYKAYEPLLAEGIKIGVAEIAVLAAAQCTEISVYRPLRVAILSTGDELVTPEQTLKPGQLVDSNQYALTAAILQARAIPLQRGIIKDDPQVLKAAISQAIATADVVLSTGGVSVGDYDYVEEILKELGAEIHIQSIAMKPGKPLTFATFPHSANRNIIYFGLPGNPVSALVTFWRFVQPVLNKLSGLAEGWEAQLMKVQSSQALRSDGKRENYLWGQINLIEGVYEFSLAGGSQSSANLINLAQTNALAVIPVGKTLISRGEIVEVLSIRS